MFRRRWPYGALALCTAFALTPTGSRAQTAPEPAQGAKPAQPPASKPSDTSPPAPQKPADKAAKALPAAADAVVLDASSLEAIIGRGAKSRTGEDMGRVVDVLVMPAGQVRAVVIDFGGFLGVGTRRIAVDWKALVFDDIAKSGDVRVSLSRDQVRMAPEYKQGDPIVLLEPTSAAAAKAAANPEPAKPTAAKTALPAPEPQKTEPGKSGLPKLDPRDPEPAKSEPPKPESPASAGKPQQN